MKKWLKITLISFVALLTVVLLVVSLMNEFERKLNVPKITVHVEGADAFLNEKELYERILINHWFAENQVSNTLNIRKIEQGIASMEEVKRVRVFKKIGGDWQVEVWLRKPIARIFKKNGASYYLDSDGFTISKTNLHTANVLLFSGEINEQIKGENVQEIINNDSLKNNRILDEIYRISNYVCNDPILHALIGQAYLEKNGDFVLIPLVGDQKIIFGSAYSTDQIEDKFKRLKVFYKEGLPYEGWDKYSEINLKYEGQIVCRKRSSAE